MPPAVQHCDYKSVSQTVPHERRNGRPYFRFVVVDAFGLSDKFNEPLVLFQKLLQRLIYV
jgi:hypothetical protein